MTDSAQPASAANRPVSIRATWPAIACLLIAAASGWMSLRLVPGNVDVSWLLVVCDRLLDGARLHVDIIEVNPPFSIWLYMPFAVLGRLTGLPAELWLAIGLPALALVSVGLSARILVRARLVDGHAAWLAPAALFILLCLFTEDFGQREQLAVVALLPWLSLLAARDGDGGFTAGTLPERLVAGVGAAVFVMVKPPMSVPALALPALLICFDRRSFRPLFTTETLVGAAITVCYLAWLAAFHMTFFIDLLPLIRDLYLPARMSVAEMIVNGPVRIFAMLAVATCAMALPRGIDRLAQLLLLAAAGYVPVFVLMGKGWNYQALPILMLGLLAFLAQLRIVVTRDAQLPLVAKGGVAVGAVILAMSVLANQPLLHVARRMELEQAAAAIQKVVAQPTVASIATRLQAAHPLTLMIGGDYRQHHPSLWPADNADALLRAAGDDPAKVERLKALRDGIILQTARDIERERPDIVFDAGSDGTPGQRAVHEHPEIARILSGYRLLYRDKVETVLVRSDLAAAAGISADARPAR